MNIKVMGVVRNPHDQRHVLYCRYDKKYLRSKDFYPKSLDRLSSEIHFINGGENMLTSFTIDYKHTSDPVGTVIGTHKNVTYNTLVPLYIPKLMSGIEKEKKRVTHIERIESNEIFINATDCKPKTKRKIITRSWLWGKLEHREYEKLKNGTKVTCDLNNDSPHEIYFSIK